MQDEEVMPVGLRPLLRQRMDEFRKRRSNGVSLREGEEGGLSTKQLLKDDAAEDRRNSQSSDENETGETEKKQNVVRVVGKLSKVVPLPDSECMNEEVQCRDHKDHEQEKGKDFAKQVEGKIAMPEPEDKNEETDAKHEQVFAKQEEENAEPREAIAKLEEESAAQHKEANAKHEEESAKHHDDDDEEEEEEEDDFDIGRCIGPGSPSFRIYCVGAENREEEKICEKSTIVIHQKSPSVESSDSESESAASASSGNTGNSNEVVETESAPKRKGHKIKKFGGMKKNLFHVKHLNINRMMACTGSDRKSHLSQH